jgi:mutator protein MutT
MTSSPANEPTRVIAAVVERHGRYLICKRPPHKRHGGMWEFPGGKIEPGETNLQATRRELEEELGLSVQAIGDVWLSVCDSASGFIIQFLEVVAQGEPQLIEHTELQWLAPEDLRQLPLAPSDRQFVEFLLDENQRGHHRRGEIRRW